MNWDDLRYLLALDRRGSLAGAARELKVSKATASRRLAALEESVGARLVERTPSGLVLTDAGRQLLAAARGIESAVGSIEEKIVETADALPRGKVRITSPAWIAEQILIPALPELTARHDGLEVDFIGTNRFLNLAQREVDLAIRNVRPTQASLVARRIAELGGCAYASPVYLRRRGTPESPFAVAGHDLLVYENLGGIPGFEWMRDEDRGARVAFRANDAVALQSAAEAGLGLAAIPCFLGDASRSLRRVASLGFSRCDVLLVVHEQMRRLARIRVVSDFVVEVFNRERDRIAG